MSTDVGTEQDLEKLRESCQRTFEALVDSNVDDIPPERRQEYWNNRHVARMAWEGAENAAFASLLDEQKRRLPELVASNVNLAHDIQAAANALAVLDLVSASLNVLQEVITVL
jgi:ribosome biogenesis protein Tsr3